MSGGSRMSVVCFGVSHVVCLSQVAPASSDCHIWWMLVDDNGRQFLEAMIRR